MSFLKYTIFCCLMICFYLSKGVSTAEASPDEKNAHLTEPAKPTNSIPLAPPAEEKNILLAEPRILSPVKISHIENILNQYSNPEEKEKTLRSLMGIAKTNFLPDAISNSLVDLILYNRADDSLKELATQILLETAKKGSFSDEIRHKIYKQSRNYEKPLPGIIKSLFKQIEKEQTKQNILGQQTFQRFLDIAFNKENNITERRQAMDYLAEQIKEFRLLSPSNPSNNEKLAKIIIDKTEDKQLRISAINFFYSKAKVSPVPFDYVKIFTEMLLDKKESSELRISVLAFVKEMYTSLWSAPITLSSLNISSMIQALESIIYDFKRENKDVRISAIYRYMQIILKKPSFQINTTQNTLKHIFYDSANPEDIRLTAGEILENVYSYEFPKKDREYLSTKLQNFIKRRCLLAFQ